MNINRKIEQAIKLIQSAYEANPASIAVGFSGGKDSSVVAELVRMSGCPIPLIYKSSTIDEPGTIPFVQAMGAKIIRPRYTFFQLLERKGVPSFNRRFCCEFLKEYKTSDLMLTGVRRQESRSRGLIEDFTRCRAEGYQEIMPILNWTFNEIKCFVKKQNVPLHPIYQHNGLRARLGCMGCPLPYSRSRADFLRRPKLLQAWIKHLKVYENKYGGFGKDGWSLAQELTFHFFFHSLAQFKTSTYSRSSTASASLIESFFHVKL